MENKIATTIEQSKKLLELGIDEGTADMYWWHYEEKTYLNGMYDGEFNKHEKDVPAWSLSALMNLMPSELELPDMYGGTIKYEIRIRKYNHIPNELDLYQIAYATNQGLSKSWHDMVNTSEQENLLDAVFEMVCYLKENKLIWNLKKKENF